MFHNFLLTSVNTKRPLMSDTALLNGPQCRGTQFEKHYFAMFQDRLFPVPARSIPIAFYWKSSQQNGVLKPSIK
jgi:hypothetical protein